MGVKRVVEAAAHLCTMPRGKKVCGLPALPCPEPFMIKGRFVELDMCLRCRTKFRQQNMPYLANGRPVPIPRMKYYEDAHGNLWISDLVRFYLQGVEGTTVNRIGQMNTEHIELWFELTGYDRDSWVETNAKFERENKIAAAKALYEDGDPETVKMVQETIEEMRAERAIADEAITEELQ